jgi:hypothetical protein
VFQTLQAIGLRHTGEMIQGTDGIIFVAEPGNAFAGGRGGLEQFQDNRQTIFLATGPVYLGRFTFV